MCDLPTRPSSPPVLSRPAFSFLNAVFSFFGALVGYDFVTFEWLLGKAFLPLAWLMGVPWAECEHVAHLIGIKTVINEFIAYRKLGILIASGAISRREGRDS